MEQRTLGTSDLHVSAIGLGCVTFGREIDRDTSWAILDHAQGGMVPPLTSSLPVEQMANILGFLGWRSAPSEAWHDAGKRIATALSPPVFSEPRLDDVTTRMPKAPTPHRVPG